MEKFQAIRELRGRLGFTQQQLANQMGLAVSSIARYEASKPVAPAILVQFANIAEEHGWHDIATVFNNAVISSLGMDARNSLLAFRRLRECLDKVSAAWELIEEGEAREYLKGAMLDLNFALNRLRENNVFTNPDGE